VRLNILKKITQLDKRTFLIAGLCCFFVISLTGSEITDLVTDYWWFDSLNLSSIWTKIFWTKAFLVAIFSLLAGFLVWINLYVVDRFSNNSLTTTFSDDDYLLQKYREIIVPRIGLFRICISTFVGLIAGANALPKWQSWLLFRNGESWGIADPIFGKDSGFYVFKLPFYLFLNDWVFLVLLLALLLSLFGYFLNGSLNPSIRKLKMGSLLPVKAFPIKVHLSVMLGLLALTRAVGYYLDRFGLLLSANGGFRGMGATDSLVRLPGLQLLILVSLVAVVLMVFNIKKPGWGFAIIGLSVWGLSHIVILGLLPAAYQRLRVDPVKSVKESEFIAHNIEFTRFAFGLDQIETRDFDFKPGLTSENAKESEKLFRKVPLVDPKRADDEFNNNQTVRGFFSFDGLLDVDRYEIGGESLPVVISSRNLEAGLVPNNWEDQHVLNTHGYGVVVAAAYEKDNLAASSAGEVAHPLDYQIEGLGVEETIVDEDFPENYSDAPQIYYSEGTDEYAVVGADRDEIDYQSRTNESVETRYSGSGGVKIDSFIRKLFFASKFRAIDPLISSSITDESKVLFNRDIRSRIKEIAPFLEIDSDPYPVVSDGKIFWITDAYTVTNFYPYSSSSPGALNPSVVDQFNYVRNSVKVVVDAYNGTVDLYAFDESDPLLKAWSKAFPDLFKAKDLFPENLLPHIRYPKDIFNVQTSMWTRYVVEDAKVFIQGDTAWSIANEPSTDPVGEERPASASSQPMKSQYLFNSVPNVDKTISEPEYVLQRFFAPKNSNSSDRAKHLTAVMMARSDPENYGELVLVNIPSGQVQTPDIVDTEIRKLASLTEYKKQRQGNTVDFGQMNLLFAGENIVYVRSVYAESGGSGNIPELVRMVVATGDIKKAMDDTLNGAIGKITNVSTTAQPVAEPEDIDDTPEDIPENNIGTPDTSSKPSSVIDALEKADQLLSKANAAENTGDLELAADLRKQAESALQDGIDLIGG